MRAPQIAFALALLVTACAHEPAAQVASTACRTPMPLELRARRMSDRLQIAYAYAPPLSVEESEHMSQLAACGGVAALGVGDGCVTEWEAARVSGLADRARIGNGRYSIPQRVSAAAAKPLGPDRTRELLTALAIAHAAERELTAIAGAHRDGPLAMMLVASDLEQAMICDSADLAAGRRVGMPYDPAAPVPDGP